MKRNLLGAIVIFFVTLAFLLVIDDISKSKKSQLQDSAENFDANDQPNLVIYDQE